MPLLLFQFTVIVFGCQQEAVLLTFCPLLSLGGLATDYLQPNILVLCV